MPISAGCRRRRRVNGDDSRACRPLDGKGVDAMEFRTATEADLPAIVGLLADDELGRGRELAADPLPRDYHDAFAAMTAQAGNRMIVAVAGGAVVGCLQLTVIHGLSRRGMARAQIEAVRVARG